MTNNINSANTASTEIVSVSFKPEITFDNQQKAMESLSSTIEQFDGFIARAFYFCEALNRWTDMITWSDVDKAKAASQAMMSMPCAEEVFPLLAEESLIMGHFSQQG